MLLIQNATIYAPEPLGKKDVLIGGSQILAIADKIENHGLFDVINMDGKVMTPGFIDQHMHVTGAGGKHGFASMTPEMKASQLAECGTTTVVGLLGTDGSSRSIKSLYAKIMALIDEGLTAYMYTGYYGLDPVHILENVQDEMIFIERVLGCKIAIADIRSSYPTDLEMVRLLRQVRTGGMIGGKKGILHIHLGALQDKMDILFRLVKDYEFPIENISPTHVGRTEELFEEAIKFARMGGMIDITTGASQYTKPHKSVLHALEKGVPIEKMTFSSDGNAGLEKKDESGKMIGFRAAPIDQNLFEVIELIKEGTVSIDDALKLITVNPATNLGITDKKGKLSVGGDADLCLFDSEWNLTDVFAMGKSIKRNSEVILKDSFA